MIKVAILATASCLAYAAGSGEHPETCFVKRGDSVVMINVDDYDAERDGELVTIDGPEAPPAPGIAAPPAPGIIIPAPPSAPSFIDAATPQTVNDDTLALITKGSGKNKRFIVVFAKDGSPVTGWRDIDEEGYATEADAWAATIAAKKQPHEQNLEPVSDAAGDKTE